MLQAAEHGSAADTKKPKVSLKSVLQYMPMVARHYKDRLPGDLEVGVEHQHLSAAMYKWEPGLEVISVQGKYGTFRAKLLNAWLKQTAASKRGAKQQAVQPSSHPTAPRKRKAEEASLTLSERGKRMFPIVKAALQDMDHDLEGVWSENCGRGVGRVLGWLPLMSRLGFLAHGRKSGRQVLHLGASGAEYCMLPDGEPAVHKKLALIAAAGDALRTCLAKPPSTADKWLASFQDFETAIALAFNQQSTSHSVTQ